MMASQEEECISSSDNEEDEHRKSGNGAAAGKRQKRQPDPVGWTRPKGKNSYVWDHFEENKARGLARCKRCLKEYQHTEGTSTTNYRRHLKNAHFITQQKKGPEPDKSQPKINDIYDRKDLSRYFVK